MLYQLLEMELSFVDSVDDLTICSIIGLAAKVWDFNSYCGYGPSNILLPLATENNFSRQRPE